MTCLPSLTRARTTFESGQCSLNAAGFHGLDNPGTRCREILCEVLVFEKINGMEFKVQDHLADDKKWTWPVETKQKPKKTSALVITVWLDHCATTSCENLWLWDKNRWNLQCLCVSACSSGSRPGDCLFPASFILNENISNHVSHPNTWQLSCSRNSDWLLLRGFMQVIQRFCQRDRIFLDFFSLCICKG